MVVYICNWCGFEGWCEVKGVSPFQSSLVDILMFLQELFELGLFHMEGLYISAISVCHIGIHGSAPGSHLLVVRFLKGVSWLRPVSKPMAPTWDLTGPGWPVSSARFIQVYG